MQLIDRKTLLGVTLLIQLAFDDLAIVRDALANHGDENVEAVIKYVRAHRNPARRPLPATSKLSVNAL